jgi:N-acetylmuramoyl-L-alanine amidase
MRGGRRGQRMNGSPPLRSGPLLFLFTLFVFLTSSPSPLAAQDLGLITTVRTLATEDATRVIISLSRPIRYQLTTEPSASDQRADLPPTRLDLIFSAATLAATIPAIARGDDALLTMVRSGQLSSSTVRITLDLTGRAAYRILDLRSPYQVVIVLRRASARPSRDVDVPSLTRRRGDAELRTQTEHAPRVEPPPQLRADVADEESKPSPESSPPVPQPQSGRRYRIMLDPGHGGHDPGAHGLHDIWEKHVVLAISKRLANKLQDRLPVEVMLTRSRDVFLSLPGRTAKANAAKADLFVSIHANASPNNETHGIETYYLNNTNDRATLRLARLENRDFARGGQKRRGHDLALILSDLIQTGKSEESIALATSVQRALVNHARSHYPDARDLGVKKGPFYVLVGAHMPCVLVETAFLSHALEGKRLGTAAYQEILAEGLFQGIARFLRDNTAGDL